MTVSDRSSGVCAPIVVFAFNRPAHLRGLFGSLMECALFRDSPIRLFVDGPRHAADAAAVDQVRAVIDAVDHPDLHAVYAPENRGLRRSIAAGVTQTIAEFGRAIVLEDDLVLARSALQYFNGALDRYADDPRVWSVAGYIYDAPELRDLPRALVLPFCHSWGWATWERAWRHFDLDARPPAEELASAAFRRAFDLNGVYPFSLLMRMSLTGLVSSWYVHWYYVIFRQGGRSIFPPRRVLDNHGISAGTHGSGFNPHTRLVRSPPLLDAPIAFPDDLDIDYFAIDALKRSWEARVQRGIAFAGAVKRRLRRRP